MGATLFSQSRRRPRWFGDEIQSWFEEPSGRGWERCGTSTWLWNYIALHYSEISPEIKVLEPSSAAIVDVVSMMSGRCGGMGATSQPCQSTTAELSYNTMCISYYLMKLVTNMVCVSYYSQSSNVVMWSLHIINLWCVHLYQVFRVHRSPGVHISKVISMYCYLFVMSVLPFFV